MNQYAFEVRLTPAARELLRPGEALILDWHRISVCCAGAGELGLYAKKEKVARKRKGLVRLKGEDPIYAAGVKRTWRAARSTSMPGRSWAFDASRPTCRRTLGFGRLWDDYKRSWKRRRGFLKPRRLSHPAV